MQARMQNPAMVVPGAMKALHALGKAAEHHDVPATTRLLIELRASQINGCGVCVLMHSQEMRKLDESDERIFSVAGWRDSPFFTDAERAVLDLTESVTRLADSSDPVPDAIWQEAAKHFGEEALGSIVLSIGLINIWNRINATTRQVAGGTW
ncbi:carboxymuconolactone decarboxylase family protein [Pseudonocardia sp. GCM10023141]|uniref:carboxymuconolactone decarboxylase family protein n=1 Tax=Pseudonocardia sp. GCM10023141 TaxID=3252653 RepID=UPI003620FA13